MDLGLVLSRSFHVAIKHRRLWLISFLLSFVYLPLVLLFRAPVPREMSTLLLLLIPVFGVFGVLLQFLLHTSLIIETRNFEQNRTPQRLGATLSMALVYLPRVVGVALWLLAPLVVVTMLVLFASGLELSALFVQMQNLETEVDPLVGFGRLMELAGDTLGTFGNMLSAMLMLLCLLVPYLAVALPALSFSERAIVLSGAPTARAALGEGLRFMFSHLGAVLVCAVVVGVLAFVVGYLDGLMRSITISIANMIAGGKSPWLVQTLISYLTSAFVYAVPTALFSVVWTELFLAGAYSQLAPVGVATMGR